MRKGLLGSAAAIAVGIGGWPAGAVAVRDDVAAAAGGLPAYYDSGNAWPSVAFLSMGCTGALVNPRMIVTAGHCFGTQQTADEAGSATAVSFQPAVTPPAEARAAAVLVHPDYDGEVFARRDVSLIALDRPVTAISPLPLAAAVPATGGTVFSVGYGIALLASAPATLLDDSRRRVVGNILDFVGNAGDLPPSALDSDTLPADQPVMAVDVDHVPADDDYNSLGSALPTALEGGGAPGDSGGPLFLLQADGSYLQVGILTGGHLPANIEEADYAIVDGKLYLGYGGITLWQSVPFFFDWIQANSFLRTASAVSGDGAWSTAAHWSGGVVPDNSSGYVTGGAARYYDVSLNQAGTTTLDMNATVDTVTVNNGGAALGIGSAYTLTTAVGTTLAAGNLDVAGGLVSPWLRVTGGTLSGSGTVTADVTQAGGTLSPGGAGAIGTLTVVGGFSQTGGLLYAELAAGAADRLSASGAVSLAGGLQVALLGTAPPADGAVFTVASGSSLDAAALAAPGAIGAVTFNLSSTGAALQVTVGRAALTGFASDATGRSVGAALDGMRGQPAFAGIFDSLDILPSFQIARALDQLGGVSTTASATARAASAQFLGAASQRVAGVRAGSGALGAGNEAALRALLTDEPEAAALLAAEQAPAGEQLVRPRLSGPTDGQGATLAEAPVFALGRDSGLGAASAEFPWGVWAQPYGVRTARRGDSAGDRWDTTIGGVSGGIDYRLRGDGVRDGLLLGLSFGYARADTGYRELTDETKSRAYQAGLYGGWWQGPWSVDAGLGFALNRYESRRDLNFGTTNASAEGRYDGREYSAYAEGRYRHEIAVGGPGVLELLPLAGVQALRLRTDGYTETGAGAMNLNVAADTVSSLRTGLGAALAYPMALSDGRSLRPELRARWSHEFGDTDAVVDASFAAAGGGAFQVASEELGRDAALLGAGLEARLSPRLSLAAAYDLQWQQGYTAQAVTGRVRVAF